MAGGEFRLGTDSIYMADDGHIRRKGTSPKFWITWLRFLRKIRDSRVFSAGCQDRKKEARPNAYASAFASCAALAASASLCTRTLLKSSPKRPSIDAPISAGRG